MFLKWSFLGLLTIAALLNATVSILTVQQSVTDMVTSFDSRSWYTTTGVIVSSSVEESLVGRLGRVYHPRIVYQYSVNAKQYTGNRVSITTPVTEARDAQDISAKYFPGSLVTVYFRGKDPTESSIAVNEPVGLQVFALVFFVAWFCFSAYLLLRLWRCYKIPANEFNKELKNQFRNRISNHSSGSR